ncbi:TonB-dependent receptor [bacterium]|nr:TonB-dependent receptor [bacterium]
MLNFRTFLLIILSGFLVVNPSFSQTYTQTLRGQIIDVHTQVPIVDATLTLLSVTPHRVTQTDEKGTFRFEKVPVGRHDLAIFHPLYNGFTKPGIPIGASKEVILPINLEEKVYNLDEVVLVPAREKGKALNTMATVSALSFEVEETRKFAGGLDDPTRLAANLPGVLANPFISDNMISIRGNSPRGMIYRLEGIDIPNPNHFARIGSSGGSFTIFSNHLLDNSDFYTGAFPAEYGNATSGVFDIHFRKGNDEKPEFAAQVGILGIDLAAEGPFKRDGRASYLVNYRYSTFGLANNIIDYLTLPEYQDISFKLHLPTTNAGTFSIFGIGGISKRVRVVQTDPALWEQDLDRFDNVLRSNMGALGVSHRIKVGERSVLRSALVGSYSFMQDNKTYLEDDRAFRLRDKNEYTRQPISLTTSLKHRFSARHINKTGIIVSNSQHDYLTQDYDYVEGQLNTLVNEAGRTTTFQAYSQSKLKLSSKFTANVGVHFLHFSLNKKSSVEPRAGISFQATPDQSFAIGYGLHSQVESFGTYMTRFPGANGTTSLPNQQLELVKSHHLVLGYYANVFKRHKVRLELYYQNLFDVPVEAGGSYALINKEELDQLRVLESTGTARNMGIDLGIERYTENRLYYLLNMSIFNSQYTGGDGITRSTAYDGGYKANFLLGKEFELGQRKNKRQRLLGLNGTFSALGGQRYTPIDMDASRMARETVYDETLAWSGKEQDLFILDFTLTLRTHRKNFSDVWAFQIKNMLQNALPEYREYDALLDEEILLKGAAVLPVISYKVEF